MRISSENGQPEIFKSLQGEGRYMGEVSTFLRLARCNLKCVWCDTPYTWNFRDFDPQAEMIQLETGKAVDIITGLEVDRLVITGGEPLLQQASLIELMQDLREDNPNFWLEVETNGTLRPRGALRDMVDQWNVSLKLSNSGNPKDRCIVPKVIDIFVEDGADFKFVIGEKSDLVEVDDIVTEFEIPKDKVFLMPEGITQEAQYEKMALVYKLAQKRGYQFTPRLQILKWGTRRGV